MHNEVYAVTEDWAARAAVDAAAYDKLYARALADPQGFWGEQGRRLSWIAPYTRVKHTSFDAHNVSIKWYEDGTTNVAMNCVDRHLPARANQTAIIWEGDDPSVSRHVTYAELHEQVCRFANVLKKHGAKRGDRITIYLPMIPEAAYAMLACARIGAVHSVVFGGFSPEALAGRIEDARSDIVVTADEGLRGGKRVPLKANVDAALEKVAGQDRARRDAHGRRGGYGEGPRLPLRGRVEDRRQGLSLRRNGRGRPAVHPLYLRLDRQAQGRAAHDRRLSRPCRAHASTRVRLSRGRRLLVHGGCRLGDRPQLYSLWPARQWRDDADVRGRAELPHGLALLGGRR